MSNRERRPETRSDSVWLMYHDVFSTRLSDDLPRSSAMYHVSADRFRAHLDAITASGLAVTTVGEYLNGSQTSPCVVLTFDDGWAGAFEVAVPMLIERGWSATFFITRDFVGRKGFCDESMLRQAAQSNMEIGIHGTSHRMLSSCSPQEVEDEFRCCRDYLESLLWTPVQHASLPGGDSTSTIEGCARRSGVVSLSTSRPGLNGAGVEPLRLRRVAVRESTDADAVARYCRFELTREKLRWAMLHVPQTVLGMRVYSHLRRQMLGETSGYRREVFRP